MKSRALLLSPLEIESNLAGLEPREARWVLEDYLAGDMAPGIALSKLVLAAGEVAEVEALIDAVERRWEPPVPPALTRLVKTLRDHRRGLERVAENLDEHPDPQTPFTSPTEGIAAARAFFDRAVRRNEEASVAAHSLGDARLLAQATREIVELFDRWRVLGPDLRTLEIGCGIGRLQTALAPRVAAAYGIDISPGMIESARRRCAGLPNVHLAVSSGRDLAAFAEDSFGFVFAVDSFPYILHAGPELVAIHFREAARVLRPGGELAILNFSYRDDVATDRRDFARFCLSSGFELLINGQALFRRWDGLAFRARKR